MVDIQLLVILRAFFHIVKHVNGIEDRESPAPDVTWLQDAACQVTSNAPNVDANGKMTWQHAVDWVSSLVYYDPIRNIDWAGWRLPRVSPVNGTDFVINNGYDGSTKAQVPV